MLLLDLFVAVYQTVCFPGYGIPRVHRSDYLAFDREQLAYLNAIEKLNCAYCAYANGVFAYVREVASRTKQYWCPIKHARRVLGVHARYGSFVDYGDADATGMSWSVFGRRRDSWRGPDPGAGRNSAFTPRREVTRPAGRYSPTS